MSLHPRPDADHLLVLQALAFLALDRPEFGDVLASLVVILYGPRAAETFAAIQQQFQPVSGEVPTFAAVAKGGRLGTVNLPRARGGSS